MWHVLGASVDLIHALAMVVWVVALPLLFVRRWPRATFAYAIYALTFVVLNQVSQWVLGECFLTTIARSFYEHRGPKAPPASHEWFTVRLAEAIFSLSPSRRSITIASEVLIMITAIGAIYTVRHSLRRRRGNKTPAPSPAAAGALDGLDPGAAGPALGRGEDQAATR